MTGRTWCLVSPIAVSLAAAPVAACGGAPSAELPREGNEMTDDSPFVCNGMDAREVLRQIVAHGADLGRSREAVFYFYGPEERLGAFQTELEALGFSVRRARAESGRIATQRIVVDEAWLARTMPRLCAAAARHRIAYDGWEAEIPEAGTQRDRRGDMP